MRPFYERAGERLIPTALTRGPWSEALQHGGPPSALLARACERIASAELWHPARVTIDFLRPIPVAAPLQIDAAITRSGKQVLGIDAELRSILDGEPRPVARARVLFIRRQPLELPPQSPPADHPRDPTPMPAIPFDFFAWQVGYHTAIEIRRESGSIGAGPAIAWLRTLHPLVADEPISPLQRVLLVADAINGVGSNLDMRRYSFVNADLTVYLHRLPDSDWIRLAAAPNPQATGVGLVHAELADTRGPIGHALESQVITVNEPAPEIAIPGLSSQARGGP